MFGGFLQEKQTHQHALRRLETSNVAFSISLLLCGAHAWHLLPPVWVVLNHWFPNCCCVCMAAFLPSSSTALPLMSLTLP